MSNIAIKVENISKRYRIGLKEELHDTFFGALASWVKYPLSNFRLVKKLSKFSEDENSEDIIWAVRDVSFKVKQGEVLGIIGRNGAGKTTLLKILCRVTEPTSGRVEINGRVASLLEVGTGFHPELTGRENVFLNGAILGMTKTEIEHKFDEIVDFSGVEKFIDTPVKRYSSGMRVRLAFSIAAYLEPEIMLVDEVLAVGDVDFQKKCLRKMEDTARGGRTVLFVSHNMGAISAFCQRTLLIDKGRLIEEGSTDNVIQEYLSIFSNLTQINIADRKDREGLGHLRFVDFWIEDEHGRQIEYIHSGQNIYFVLNFVCDYKQTLKDLVLSIVVLSSLGQPLLLFRNDYSGDYFSNIPEKGFCKCYITNFPLVPGTYNINIYAESRKNELVDWIKNARRIEVLEGDFYSTGHLPPKGHAPILCKHKWILYTD